MSDATGPEDSDDLDDRLREHLPNIDSMTEEEKAAWAMSVLEQVPPDEMRKMILERGTLDLVANLLQERAASSDPEVRDEARAIIEQFGLDLLLVDEVDDGQLSGELDSEG